MSQSVSETDQAITTEYVLERLSDARQSIADALAAVEGSPHEPPRDMEWHPPGGLSVLEAVGTAIYAAEERWGR